MRLYHHTNDPHSVLPGADPEYDDVELALNRSSARGRDHDVVIRIEVPDGEMDRLTPNGKGAWTATNAELRLAGVEIDCATANDEQRAAVYKLVADRRVKLDTIAKLRRYIDEATDRPEASGFAAMLRAHQDHLSELDRGIADAGRHCGIRHLDLSAHQEVNA